MMPLSLICFYEIKVVIVQRNFRNLFLGLQKCDRKYIAFFTINLLFISMILSYSYLNDGFDPLIPLTTTNILTFIWIVVIRPYKNTIHNIGVIANNLPLLLFLGWNITRKYYLILQVQKN